LREPRVETLGADGGERRESLGRGRDGAVFGVDEYQSERREHPRATASSSVRIISPSPCVARAVTGTDIPSGSVMPTTSAASTIAVHPSLVSTMPYAAQRGAAPAPFTRSCRRSPPQDNTASSVPSPPSAIGHARISTSGHTRASPRAIADEIAFESSEPLNESGAMTTIGGRAAGMAYDFSRTSVVHFGTTPSYQRSPLDGDSPSHAPCRPCCCSS